MATLMTIASDRIIKRRSMSIYRGKLISCCVTRFSLVRLITNVNRKQTGRLLDVQPLKLVISEISFYVNFVSLLLFITIMVYYHRLVVVYQATMLQWMRIRFRRYLLVFLG